MHLIRIVDCSSAESVSRFLYGRVRWSSSSPPPPPHAPSALKAIAASCSSGDIVVLIGTGAGSSTVPVRLVCLVLTIVRVVSLFHWFDGAIHPNPAKHRRAAYTQRLQVGIRTSRSPADRDHGSHSWRRRYRRRICAGTRRGSRPGCRWADCRRVDTCCSVIEPTSSIRGPPACWHRPCRGARRYRRSTRLRSRRRPWDSPLRNPRTSRSLASQSSNSARSIRVAFQHSSRGPAQVSDDVRARGSGSRASSNLATPIEGRSAAGARPVSSRPSASTTVALQQGSRLMTCTACTGGASARSEVDPYAAAFLDQVEHQGRGADLER